VSEQANSLNQLDGMQRNRQMFNKIVSSRRN